MIPDVSAVVVSHRSSEEAARCVASLAECFRREDVAGETVLVDCGSGAEARVLESAGADLFLPLTENRGYAGGVNAGLARARSARVLLANADVVFLEGALTPLLEAIADPRVGAAGPLAFWDTEDTLRLPPGWAPSFSTDFAQLAAGRRPARDDIRFASFARETVRLWERGGDARHLSGAVLAARRDVFDRVGRFDERFPLEYEETEWEDRVRAAGLALRFEPRSRVRHVWGASSAASPESARRRDASRRRYQGLRYGRVGRAVLDRIARRSRPGLGGRDGRAPMRDVPRISQPRLAGRNDAWVAVSPNPSILPFAGAPLDPGGFELPAEIAGRLPRGALYLRAFRASDGCPLETAVWERP